VSAPRNDPRGLFVGRYAFHLHTTATDGHLTVADYVGFAQARRLDRLIFLEHVRREPTYDVDAFVAEVHREAAAAGVAASVGFEAKLLPGGALDIGEGALAHAEVVGLAEHGFPDDDALYWVSLDAALERCAALAPAQTVVWVHPGLYLRRRGRLEASWVAYRERVERALDLGVAVERNLRYGLAPDGAADDEAALVTGVDAHRWRDLERAFPPGG